MSLQRTLFLLIAIALLAGLVPAGLVLDRRLAAELERRARVDLELAPQVLADREAMKGDMLTMHADDLANTPALAQALEAGDRARAVELLAAARAATETEEEAVLVGPAGEMWHGVVVTRTAIDATRQGATALEIALDGVALRRFALSPVRRDGRWLGAAGVTSPVDLASAGTLAGLTRSEVVILTSEMVVAATTDEDAVVTAVADSLPLWRGDGLVHQVSPPGGRRHLVTYAPLGDVGTVAFLRDLDHEMAALPQLRRDAALAGLFALGVALVLGALLAMRLARPVRSLAAAAERLAGGDFQAPLGSPATSELDRLAKAFAEMRHALAARIEEVEESNRELAERQRRLTALQAELIRRDRLAATGLLVTELAHEIRNPVANVLNCLEVVRRRVAGDPAAREFADMAIDELLRMHELAERMLDLNRPRDPDQRECDVTAVAEEVAGFVRAGSATGNLEITVSGAPDTRAAIPPDALKQVLLNIVQNARDALEDRGRIELGITSQDSKVVLEVSDNGPGIAPDVLPKLFDPFFTTKARVQGVGLGLFVAEGILSGFGGRIEAGNRDPGPGACFRIELSSTDSKTVQAMYGSGHVRQVGPDRISTVEDDR